MGKGYTSYIKRRNFVKKLPHSGDGFKSHINYANELESEARKKKPARRQTRNFLYKEEIS